MKRISILVWILCACFVSVAWGQKNGWSEFHRPDMTRFNPSEKVLNVNNVADLQLKWRYPAASSDVGLPAVANGVVYVGSGDHIVYALNARTGVLLWSYTTGGDADRSPAVANGVVYVSSADYVYAFGLK